MKSLRALINKNIKIVVLFVVALVIFAVWNTFLKSDEVPVFSSETDQATNSEVGREIVSTLSKLNTVNINTDVLQNDVFNQLRDFSQPLPSDLQVSKNNPFIAGSSGAQTSTTDTSDQTNSAVVNTAQNDQERAGSENDAPAQEQSGNDTPLQAEVDTNFNTQTQ